MNILWLPLLNHRCALPNHCTGNKDDVSRFCFIPSYCRHMSKFCSLIHVAQHNHIKYSWSLSFCYSLICYVHKLYVYCTWPTFYLWCSSWPLFCVVSCVFGGDDVDIPLRVNHITIQSWHFDYLWVSVLTASCYKTLCWWKYNTALIYGYQHAAHTICFWQMDLLAIATKHWIPSQDSHMSSFVTAVITHPVY